MNYSKYLSALSLVPYFFLILFFYFLWAIQPVFVDDWSVAVYDLFRIPCLPKTGQQIRYCLDGRYILIANPFSLFQPWILVTSIFVVTLLWRALSFESMWIKAVLTFFVVLGFPYLGHIGPWNLAASEYTVSAIWALCWYLLYDKIRTEGVTRLNTVFLFIMSFIAATWYELWIAAFFGIVLFLGIKAFISTLQKKAEARIQWPIFLAVSSAYLLVLIFYMYKGPAAVVEARGDFYSGYFMSLMNSANFIEAILHSKSYIVQIFNRSIPLFCFILYLKLNKSFSTKLERDLVLFVCAILGVILFIFVLSFTGLPFHYRTQLLAVFVIAACAFAFPKSMIDRSMQLFCFEKLRKASRVVLFTVVIFWMGYNGYFTYFYNNIDVPGWLEYRKMVVSRDPKALDGFCCRTFLFERPKGNAQWYHEWGEQDDEYRSYSGPDFLTVKDAVSAYWAKKESPVIRNINLHVFLPLGGLLTGGSNFNKNFDKQDHQVQAAEYLKKNDGKNAFKSLEKAIRQDPADISNYLLLGKIYLILKNYKRAIYAFAAATRVSPNSADAYYFLTLAYGADQNLQDALRSIGRSLMIYRQENDQKAFQNALRLFEALKSRSEFLDLYGTEVKDNFDHSSMEE